MAVKTIQQPKFKNENIIIGDTTYTFSADLLKKAAVKEVKLDMKDKLAVKFIYKPKDGSGKSIEFKDVTQKISKALEKAYPAYSVKFNYSEDEYGMPYLTLFLKKK